jgi:hypothetical protein
MSRVFLVIPTALAVLALASCGGGNSSSQSSSAPSNTQAQGPTSGSVQGTANGQAQGKTTPKARSKSKREGHRSGSGGSGGTGATGSPAQGQARQHKGSARRQSARKKKRKGPLSIKRQRRILNRLKPYLRSQQRDACRTIGAEVIFRQYHTQSLAPTDLARAYAQAFVKKSPQFPYDAIYQGCLDGLTGK